MSSSEPDAHGRIHRSVEISADNQEMTGFIAAEQSDDDGFYVMSDGEKIPSGEVLNYYGNQEPTNDESDHHRKIDAIVLSTAATMSLGAIGLAIYRSRKK